MMEKRSFFWAIVTYSIILPGIIFTPASATHVSDIGIDGSICCSHFHRQSNGNCTCRYANKSNDHHHHRSHGHHHHQPDTSKYCESCHCPGGYEDRFSGLEKSRDQYDMICFPVPICGPDYADCGLQDGSPWMFVILILIIGILLTILGVYYRKIIKEKVKFWISKSSFKQPSRNLKFNEVYGPEIGDEPE